MSDLRPGRRVLTALLGLSLGAAGALEAQSWATLRSARQVQNREAHEVNVQYGAGKLTVRPADQPLLYQLDLRYDEERFTPVSEFDAGSRKLRLGVRSVEGSRRRGINVSSDAHATLALTREVPLNLELEFGAGEADIDLGGISIQRLRIATGASETRVRVPTANPQRASSVHIEAGAADLRVEGIGNLRADRVSFQGGVGSTVLDFSGAWAGNATASVQMGIGSVTLRFPRGMGVRVNRSSFLTSFSPEEMRRDGNSYFSSNWETAGQRLTVDVSAALGSIQIEWIGNP